MEGKRGRDGESELERVRGETERAIVRATETEGETERGRQRNRDR